MEELEVIKTGEMSDGRFYALVAKDFGDLQASQMIVTNTKKEVGDTCKIPTAIVAKFDWSF